MKLIPLSRGKFARVDDEDYERLSQHGWICTYYGYAARTVQVHSKRQTIWMHREVNHTPPGLFTDHINGDRLDNQKGNLRTATLHENRHNTRKRTGTTSRYHGVYWFTPVQKWASRYKRGEQEVLMYWDSELMAAMAWNHFASKYDDGFGVLNDFTGVEISRKLANLVLERIQNYTEKGLSQRNTSGEKGVSWSKAANKWIVYCRTRYLGVYESLEEAAAVSRAAHQQG